MQHTLKWECRECINEVFIEHSQFYHIRPLFYTMILASIIVSYIFTWVGYLHDMIFWHPSNNTFNTWQRVMFFCSNIAAGDDGVSWKFFCLIKSYMAAIWSSEELQRSTIIFFCLIKFKNLRAHAIDFYWRMFSNSKWSLTCTIMHFFHESFNKIWICARKKLAKMNHENSFF